MPRPQAKCWKVSPSVVISNNTATFLSSTYAKKEPSHISRHIFLFLQDTYVAVTHLYLFVYHIWAHTINQPAEIVIAAVIRNPQNIICVDT